MKYLFELSKEHKKIPTSEIIACLKSENICFSIIESNEDVFIVETDSDDFNFKRFSERLSYTYYIDRYLFSCPPSIVDLKKEAIKNKIESKGSIAVRCKNRSKNINSQDIIRTLADVYSSGREVELDNPDLEVRGLITDSAVYIGLKLIEINRSQFEERKVQFRPFFSPISLHPKIARLMVNLSSIKNNETLLDPFCGTGGILIEAGIIGAKIIGSDIEEKMIEGCKKNLDFYKIKNYKLFCSDIGDISKDIGKVDAVVTDLPYGKSTTTKGEDMSKLYERAFKNISTLLKENGKAVIGLSNKDFINLGKKYFSIIEKHDLRAHRSLTRYFVVYQK
ncbi:MAG: methyltransferase domain-containing protein [Thermoplasmatales archaeon]|nr:MAG: methyltransferase domain-containing protein [Thermoplasmatales archaeon]